MKIDFKVCLLLFLGFFFFMQSGKAQEVIEHKGDTMIVISPTNLKTINSIIVDYENTRRQNSLYSQIIQHDSIRVCALDSVIAQQKSIIQKQQVWYFDSVKELEKDLKKERRKKTVLTSVLGGVAVILGLIAISK